MKKNETQVWFVFDRDREDEQGKIVLEDVSFDEVINIASRRGLKLAWSNDSFELWVLLHFEDVDPTIPGNKSRNTQYQKLTGIFENLPNPNSDLQKVKTADEFHYKKHLKQRNNFRNIVRAAMISRTNQAIERAKILEGLSSKSTEGFSRESSLYFGTPLGFGTYSSG